MGVDLIGKHPMAKWGEHYRASWGFWSPLIEHMLPVSAVMHRCRLWHSNDGDGLNASDAMTLADELDSELDDGSITDDQHFLARKLVCFLRACGGFEIY